MNVPFDPLSSVVLPALSILVSAGIAILVVVLERRAASRGRLREELARLSRELTILRDVAHRNDVNGVTSGLSTVSATINAIATVTHDKDLAVLKFVNGILHVAAPNGNIAISRAADFASTALEGWMRGKLTSKEFDRVLPTAMAETWTDSVKLSDWATHTKSK